MAKRNILVSYKTHSSMHEFICFYCGWYAETKDHVPAVSHAHNYPDYERVIVRACRLCNGLLGARFLPTILERLNYLQFKLKKRFNKHISMPDWSDDEIGELEGKLKISITTAMKRKKSSLGRIKHVEGMLQELQDMGGLSE